MIRSVARHCEPTHHWTRLNSLLSLRRGTERRQEPHFLNGPVPSRIISTAVLENGNPIFQDTELQASDSLKSACNSAERRQMFEATRSLPDAAYAAKRTATDFTLEIKQPLSEPLSLATRKQGSRSSTIAVKIHPSEKICRFYRATGTYCLTLKNIQMFCILGLTHGSTEAAFRFSIRSFRFSVRDAHVSDELSV